METAGSALTLCAGAKKKPRPQQTLVKKANAAQTAQFCENKMLSQLPNLPLSP